MNDSPDQLEQPPESTRFPFQRGKPAPKGNKYHRTHGLTAVLLPKRHKRRKAIDTRFREGKETVAFRAALIAMKGGEDDLTPTQLAVVDLLTAKYYRLLKVYTYLYRQPPPPVVDERKKRIHPLWNQVDGMEDSLLRAAKEYGFARVARTLTLQEALDKDDEPANGAADEGSDESK
jgi:hypothetical protein